MNMSEFIFLPDLYSKYQHSELNFFSHSTQCPFKGSACVCVCVCCTSLNHIRRIISFSIMSCPKSRNTNWVNGANLWLYLWFWRWVPGKCLEVGRVTHRAGVCCEGWPTRSSCCSRRVVGFRDDGCVPAVSPVRVQLRGCRSSPNSSARKWLMLAGPLPSPLFLQCTLSHLDEARTSLWLRGGDRLTNDREEGGAEGESEEGIERREGGIFM